MKTNRLLVELCKGLKSVTGTKSRIDISSSIGLTLWKNENTYCKNFCTFSCNFIQQIRSFNSNARSDDAVGNDDMSKNNEKLNENNFKENEQNENAFNNSSAASFSNESSNFSPPPPNVTPPLLFDGETEILTPEQQKQKEELIAELTRRLSGPLADEHGNVPTGKDRPTAIEVDGPSHFYANSVKYTAYTKLKHRLLTRMGYRVLHVPYFEWRKLRGAKEREEYMKNKLNEDPSEWLDPEDEKYYTQRIEALHMHYNNMQNNENSSSMDMNNIQTNNNVENNTQQNENVIKPDSVEFKSEKGANVLNQEKICSSSQQNDMRNPDIKVNTSETNPNQFNVPNYQSLQASHSPLHTSPPSTASQSSFKPHIPSQFSAPNGQMPNQQQQPVGRRTIPPEPSAFNPYSAQQKQNMQHPNYSNNVSQFSQQQFPWQQSPQQQSPQQQSLQQQIPRQQSPGQQSFQQQMSRQQSPGQQSPQQQMPRQQSPGQQFPGQQFPGQQSPGQQSPQQQSPGQQFFQQPFPQQQFPHQHFPQQQIPQQQFLQQQFPQQQFPQQQFSQQNFSQQNFSQQQSPQLQFPQQQFPQQNFSQQNFSQQQSPQQQFTQKSFQQQQLSQKQFYPHHPQSRNMPTNNENQNFSHMQQQQQSQNFHPQQHTMYEQKSPNMQTDKNNAGSLSDSSRQSENVSKSEQFPFGPEALEDK